MPLSIPSPQQAALRSCRSFLRPGRYLYNLKTSRRRIHHVPKLAHDDHFREHGVGQMLSKGGYDIAWTQYQGYLVEQLNQMTASTKEADRPTRDLLLTHARNPSSASLFNHASMAWNTHHTMTTLSPTPILPSESLTKRITRCFSSPTSLKKTFLATANAMFGPGFVWLIKSNTVRTGNMNNDPQLTILCTYIAGSPLPGAHFRQQDVDMNTQNATSLGEMRQSMMRAGSIGASSGSLDARLGLGGSSHEVMLGVCTWEHFWLRDWGVGGKKEYLEAWWEAVDWDVVEKNGNFENGIHDRAGSGLPGQVGRQY